MWPDRGSEEGLTKSPLAKCSSRAPLVRGGLGLLCWLDADKAAVTALIFKLHKTGHERKERVVLALADVFSRLVLGAAPTHQNRICVAELPAERLDPHAFPVWIAAVYQGGAALLICRH